MEEFIVANTNQEPTENPHEKDINKVNDERKHLEGLLKDRINFHLLFAGVFMAGLSSMTDKTLRFWVCLAITIISFIIFAAVYRTTLLVRRALDEILNFKPAQPYRTYSEMVWFKLNANNILLVVPLLLTVAFGIATRFCWRDSHPLAATTIVEPEPCIINHIENYSHGADASPIKEATKQTGKKGAPPPHH